MDSGWDLSDSSWHGSVADLTHESTTTDDITVSNKMTTHKHKITTYRMCERHLDYQVASDKQKSTFSQKARQIVSILVVVWFSCI